MRTICFICLLIVFLTPGDNPAAVSRLSDSQRKLLTDLTLFRPLKNKSEIPPAVLVLCTDLQAGMADIGQRWEATDVITNDTLPRKRLIWALVYQDYDLIHYERGGRGHSFHVLLAQIRAGGKADVLWRAVGDKYPDVAAFRKALANNQLDDDPKFAY